MPVKVVSSIGETNIERGDSYKVTQFGLHVFEGERQIASFTDWHGVVVDPGAETTTKPPRRKRAHGF